MKRPRMPSRAMTVAGLALAIALSGVSYAAIAIPRNSVGTQLKNKQPASKELPGPMVRRVGAATVTGSSPADSTIVASLALPAGSFVATASARFKNLGDDTIELRCRLSLAGLSDEKSLYLHGSNPSDIDVLAFTIANTQGSSSPAQVLCFLNGGTSSRVDAFATITAVKVATLN